MPRGELLAGQLYCEMPVDVIIESLEAHATRYEDTFAILMLAWAEEDEKFQSEYREYSIKYAEGSIPPGTAQPMPPLKIANHKDRYLKWIGFFSDTIDDEITLTSQEHSQFMLDNWDFIASHVRNLRHYASLSANTISADSIQALSLYET